VKIDQLEEIEALHNGADAGARTSHWIVTIRARDKVLRVGEGLQLDERTARWIANRLRRLLGG